MSSNKLTIDTFFDYFQTPGKYSQTVVDNMMAACFSPQPSAGIAVGATPTGPQFIGYGAVEGLFVQLITSFPNLNFTSVAPYCPSADLNTVYVESLLDTGAFTKPWFPDVNKGYSKPLSDIDPDGKSGSKVPACAVFRFDPQWQYKINQFSIYMDRWQMAYDLWPHPKKDANSKVRPFPTPI